MATSSEMAAFDRGVRPLMQIVLPEKAEAVIGFRADPELQQRIRQTRIGPPFRRAMFIDTNAEPIRPSSGGPCVYSSVKNSKTYLGS